jgi:thiol-disulfide isomerase/thioredoxin
MAAMIEHAPNTGKRVGLLAALGLGVLLLLTAPEARPPANTTRRAYDFSLRDINPKSPSHGQVLRLSELYAERGLVLNFMASWCLPCRVELPALESVHASGRARVVCMAADEYGGPEDVQQVIQLTGLTLPVLFAPENVSATLARHYTYAVIPATYMIDRSGVVRSTFLGPVPEERLLDAIRQHLD